MNDPVTRKLASKVALVVDPAIEAVYPAQFGARVRLELSDGSVHQRTVLDCHGTPVDPCSRQELLDKFRLLAGACLPADLSSDVSQLVETVTALSTVHALTAPLHAAAAPASRLR